MDLSEREKELYEFIKAYEGKATTEIIEKELSAKYLGALGRLLRNDLIVKKKRKAVGEDGEPRPYTKMIRYYVVKE